MSLIRKWFGFEGWKELTTKKSIFLQITWRIGFAIGLIVFIVAYGIAFDKDPPLEALCGILLIWFLIYQAILNFIFVQGSR
ncbi:MAG: hypothetical protein QF440_05210 [Candidatus Thalassarchaeaceae archaeon]|jgi:hypothetical protein|nr:hypothetical protein [Candidatus Thalassarchaeaceae archaeon]